MTHSLLTLRLRRISRLALYGSLGMTAVVALVLLYIASAPLRSAQAPFWKNVDYKSLEEVRLLRQYVQIDTTKKTGSTLDGALFLAHQLEAAGVPYHLEYLGSDDANLWAILEGDDPHAIVLHHHIDVEDIHYPDAWKQDPFGAEIHTPWLYGRGTFDMKSIGIAELLAFLDLARSGQHLKRSVIFLATAGEETGSELGTQWILRHHPELVQRFGVVFTEGGVVEGRSRAEIKYWGTETAQKQFWTLTVCDPSRERLEALRQDVFTYGAEEPQLFLVDEAKEFLPLYAPSRGTRELRDELSDPARIVRDRPLFETLPTYVEAMFRNELHPLPVVPEPGGGWQLPVKIHLLPGIKLEDVRDHLMPDWLFFGFETHLDRDWGADHGSPIHHWALDAIRDAVHEDHPGVPVGPLFLPWTATDARYFRALGIPAYGFSPFPFLTTDVLRVSGPGERIALPDFVDGVALYKRLLRRMAE